MFEFIKNLYTTGFLKDIVIPLCVCVVAAFVPVIFNRGKLKTEQRFQVTEKYTEKRLEAVISIKKIISEIDVLEIYNLINRDDREKKADAIKDPLVYPQIMKNYKTLKNFYKGYKKVYSEQVDWVNRQANTYLFYGQQYFALLFSLLTDYGDFGITDSAKRCQYIGTVVAIDLQEWQRNFDKVLTKSLNKPSLKSYSKTSVLYKYYRNYRKKEIEKTILYRLLFSDKGPSEELNIMMQEIGKATKRTLFLEKLKLFFIKIARTIQCYCKAIFLD